MLRRIMAALGAAFRGIFGRLGFLGHWLEDLADDAIALPRQAWNGLRDNWPAIERGAERVLAVPLMAAEAVLSVPGAVIGALFGRGGQPEQAQTAAQRQASVQQQADANEDTKIRIHSVRRIASSRSKGQQPEADAVASLDRKVVAYLSKLSPEECGVLAVAKTASLRALLEKGEAPVGVRSPQQVAEGFSVRVIPPSGSPPAAGIAPAVAVPGRAVPTPRAVGLVDAWRQRHAPATADRTDAVGRTRRIVVALAAGRQPASSDCEALPKEAAFYLGFLRRDEAAILAAASTAEMTALVRDGVPPPGVRSPSEVGEIYAAFCAGKTEPSSRMAA